MKGALDALIASGEIQPTIAIMPDAPWSSRASYYVDSGYTGADPGRKVETAFTKDLIAHVDATYRTVASRTGRGIAGYSMGGYGALRYSLAHPDLFGASIVLSPAVYVPSPPSDSSTREFGAFGLGKSLFVDSIYKKLNYPALFPSFSATGLSLPMFIAVGDDEFKNPDPKDAIHDLDFEAHVLFNQAVRVPNLTAELRVVDGGHDWDVWGPTFVEGAKYIFQFLNQTPVTPMKATLIGTAQEERAGGVATDAAGNVYQALAAGGSVAGQPYAGDKDLVLVKDSPAGTRLWTRELGTTRLERAYGVAIDPAGNAVVTGYTNGDLDGAHAGNTTDDVFVAKFDPNGNLTWLRQFGVAAVADRGYALATDAAGNVYVTGYTRGNLGATNVGNGTQDDIAEFGIPKGDLNWAVEVADAGAGPGCPGRESPRQVHNAGSRALEACSVVRSRRPPGGWPSSRRMDARRATGRVAPSTRRGVRAPRRSRRVAAACRWHGRHGPDHRRAGRGRGPWTCGASMSCAASPCAMGA